MARPDYPGIPTAAADPLGRRGFSRSPSSTYRCGYACVVLTCEKPRRPSVSAASLRHSRIIMAGSALEQAKGNVSEAARLLKVTRNTLRYRMGKYNLKAPE